MGGVSIVEMLIKNELRAGERLTLETALPSHQTRGRSIAVSAAPVTAGLFLAFQQVHGCHLPCADGPWGGRRGGEGFAGSYLAESVVIMVRAMQSWFVLQAKRKSAS